MKQDSVSTNRGWTRWLPWLGAILGIAAIAWVLWGFDLARFGEVIAGADVRFILIVPLALIAEQVVRASKWRQLLWPLRRIGTAYLFGAIMAGYLLAVLVPFGFGTVARSWLVARREQLRFPAVLATVAVDRLTDGIVFACLVPLALVGVAFADPDGGIRTGLVWAGAGSLILFCFLLFGLAAYRGQALNPNTALARMFDRLPPRLGAPLQRLAASFAEGIDWPRETWRGGMIVLAALLIKLIAATHFLWAGLAFGVLLSPAEYLFLIVFLGFLVILGHFARVAGSFLIGAVFALGLLGVEQEQALAMALVVEASNLLSVSIVGAVALWHQGMAISELRQTADAAATPR